LKWPPMRAPIWICAEGNSRRQPAPCNASDGECGWPQMRTSRCVRPNVGGNRRADEMLAEDQTVCRCVRLTARLGHYACDGHRVRRAEPASCVI
jgi:hypothetical protein